MSPPERSPRARPARPADARAIVGIERAAGREGWTLDQADSAILHAQSASYVLVDGGRVKAHLLATLVIDEAEILTVAVDPAEHGRGLGTELLAHCLAAWVEAGATRVVLEVRVSNVPARALYARFGFAEVGRRPVYYADGEDGLVLAWTVRA